MTRLADKLVRPKEAARMLGVSNAAVHKLTDRGALLAVVVTPGGHARFRRGDVEQFRAARTAKP